MFLKEKSKILIWPSLFGILIFAIAYLFFNWGSVFTICDETGDLAANAIQIERAKYFGEFLGPYGRFGFNHPGPILFYIYAFGDLLFGWLLPSKYGVYNFTQLLLNLFFISYASIIVSKHLRLPIAGIILLGCLLFTFKSLEPSIFHFTWGPAALLAPILFFLVSSAALFQRDRSVLPAHLFSVLIATQTHLGTLTLVVPIETIVIFFLFYKDKELTTSKRLNLILPFTIFALCYLPPVIEAIINWPDGNINKIITFFAKNKGVYSLNEAYLFIHTFFERALQISLRSLLWPVPLILACLSFSPWPRNSFFKTLAILITSAFILTIFAASRVVGELFSHVLWYETTIVALFIFLCLIWIVLILSEIIYVKRFFEMTSLMLILITAVPLYFTYTFYRFAPSTLCDGSISEIIAAIEPKKGTLYDIQIRRQSQWYIGAGLVLRLLREDIDVCVPKRWIGIFGHDLICNEKSDQDNFKSRTKVSLFSAKKYDGPLNQKHVVVGTSLVFVESL